MNGSNTERPPSREQFVSCIHFRFIFRWVRFRIRIRQKALKANISHVPTNRACSIHLLVVDQFTIHILLWTVVATSELMEEFLGNYFITPLSLALSRSRPPSSPPSEHHPPEHLW